MKNININNSNNPTIYQNNDKCVTFISNDQKIMYGIACPGNSIFLVILYLLKLKKNYIKNILNIEKQIIYFQLMEKKFLDLKLLMIIIQEQENQ